MRWRRRRREIDPREGGGDIGDECALFLAGRYAEHLRSGDRCPPPWVWLNPLAHGTRDELVARAAGGSHDPGTPEWSGAVTFLAASVLEIAGDDAPSLWALQRDVLIPLELRLATERSERMTPARFVRLVSADLHA